MTNFANMTTTQVYTPEQIDRRARAVSINAVRELRVAYGRDAGPWTDDDSRRVQAIYDLLHLAKIEDINASVESFPLVSPQQAPENEMLDNIERHLSMLSGPISHDKAPYDPEYAAQNIKPAKIPAARAK
jgi:hypothetical protein